MSESVQITIPDFDDDDYSIPFGRSGAGGAFGHGGGNGGFGSGGGVFGMGAGQDSPTLTTPIAERSYFPSHTRGDSVASEDSTNSFTTPGSSTTAVNTTFNSSRYYASTSKSSTSASNPFGHSSQSSIATTGTIGFTKKPSFASIRNAFKKNNDAPPVPPLFEQQQQQPYPVLKNPFNRSTSSLNHAGPSSFVTSGARAGTPSSPYNNRPPTPGGHTNNSRGTPSSSKSKSHAHGKSQHSQTGSVFYTSDGGGGIVGGGVGVGNSIGSDQGHGFSFAGSSSPPPVPRVPNAFAAAMKSETTLVGLGGAGGSMVDLEEDKVVMNLKTPSDYALHALFIRFAASAEGKIDAFLRQSLDVDPLLSDFMGPGVDSKFDDLLNSLGKIAQKHAKPVVDSIMGWRKSQNENVGSDISHLHGVPHHGNNSNNSNNNTRGNGNSMSATVRAHEIPGLLNERKSLASIYLTCRALVAVLQAVSRDALGESMGYRLEETTFEQFRRPELKLLAQSANHRLNAELFASLLGHIANIRFVSVTDRFLAELGPVASGQVPKDSDMKYENLVKGLKHIQIKVWPPEAFEEGAEFLEALSKSFANTHGLRLKTAFAQALVHLLHPIGKTAQAETNNPQWAKAIETIYPKAKEMMSKPRYWNVAFPLAITSLCVAPQSFFLKHWLPCLENTVLKLKEKPYRTPLMNGIIRLIWTYLYRCQESPSTTMTKLESVMKHFFPPNRLTVHPQEDHLEPLIFICHFILSRHFEFGRDFCLDQLLQQSSLSQTPSQATPGMSGGNSNSNSSLLPFPLAPERITVAIQAILLSLSGYERDVPTPTWPSTSSFTSIPPWQDYPTSSSPLPATLLTKPALVDLLDRTSTIIATLVRHCFAAVGTMSVFDEQWNPASGVSGAPGVGYEEMHGWVARKHGDGTVVVFPNQWAPMVTVLQACFQAWPRCLRVVVAGTAAGSAGSAGGVGLALEEAVDMLIRGVVHVDPAVQEAAGSALTRFMTDPAWALVVVERFTAFLFGKMGTGHGAGGNGIKLMVESRDLLALWVGIVDGWIKGLMQKKKDLWTEEEERDVIKRAHDLEAAGLFLMSHQARVVHTSGVKIIRILGLLVAHMSQPQSAAAAPTNFLHIVELLHGKGLEKLYLTGYDELLDTSELARLNQWRNSTRIDIPLRIADSTHEKDRKIWNHVFPSFLQFCLERPCQSMRSFRETLVAAASRYHPSIAHLAGLSSRVPPGLPTRPNGLERDAVRLLRDHQDLVSQWYLWVKILCATGKLPDAAKPALTQLGGREHARAPSDVSFERERMWTTRGLFRYLTPFLDSEYEIFRDAAVLCISSFPEGAYAQLLVDLSPLAGRQSYDDPRAKTGAGMGGGEMIVTGVVGGRQYEDMRPKALSFSTTTSSSVAIDRTRRQERLHSAVARIYYLTAQFLQHQRGTSRQAALANVLKFVRNTQAFLMMPEMRDNHTLQRLRRYFCGTVEKLFEGMAGLKDSDRFVPANMHLTLYRLCEEWCQLGPQTETVRQRLVSMQRAAASSAISGGNSSEDTAEVFRRDTLALSHAAVGALSSVCQKAFFPPDMSSGSPTDRQAPEHLRPLTPITVLERLSAILASEHPLDQERGKKALKSLLLSNINDSTLTEESLKRAVVTTDKMDTSHGRFFEVISDIVCHCDEHGFRFAQIVCLGLSNLRHPVLETRRQAFNMLEAVHQQSEGLLTMSHFEATVGSLAAGAFVHAHRLISDFLAGEHPDQANDILAQFSSWLPQLPDSASDTNLTLLLLQSLEFWIPNIDLMTEDKTRLSKEGLSALYHLMSLTLRYGQTHTEQILMTWTRLVDTPNQSNGHATVRFLLEHSHKVGSPMFTSCAANIVACLCQTHIGRQIFEDLCSVIEPARMLPTIEHKLSPPDAHDAELWSDLDALFADQPRLQLGSAQFAWLFLADVALQGSWELKAQLPVLLHALFTHIDHRIPFVRNRAQRMLFQLLRSWTPGYEELPDRSANPGRTSIKDFVNRLETEAAAKYWKDEDSSSESEPKMKWLCSQVLKVLEPLCPFLADRWGSLALSWGTACSIRATAFRSLQIFRALMPRVKQTDLALLLGRLSNTVAASDENIQSFTAEIILTINAVATVGDIDKSLLPQMFWCACACLSTTVETEFARILNLTDSLLTRIDLDDPSLAFLFLTQRPLDWEGSASLQSALLPGLRSSTTLEATLRILKKLAKIKDGRLIDPTDSRVRDLYTLSLPWCLHAMANDNQDDSLKEFAQDIGALAAHEGRQSIQKIMTSFSKNHFRTKDDFLRQSVSSLREHYGADYWTEIVTLLMGLALNRERWLRIQVLQILKLLFQQRETRNPVELLGSDLLMPLLRLLETDLASQALDVLEEPMTMSGGPAAKHVLRMSMHFKLPQNDSNGVAAVFGVPDESGWCIAQTDTQRETCRSNVMAVFDTCSMPTRPSRIEFEPEVEALASLDVPEEELGDLVNDLHELTSFFQKDADPRHVQQQRQPDRRLEARMAAILAKSTAIDALPPTPINGVFTVGGLDDSDHSDDSDDSDSDLDAFVYDSPSVYRSAPNGARYHH